MKNNKVEAYQKELERNNAKKAAINERNRKLEQMIREAETMAIFALMQAENLSMDGLYDLVRSRKEDGGLPPFTGKQADAADDDLMTATDDDTDYRRDEYEEDDDEYEDDE